ncbi:cationic amino acid transporter 5-like [Triticum urartu]|uniref:cationic amino acid transporter 5-like n=1 Tax=Triticum urartu TaxID=4572 RepID=UPI00204498FA|nr:cationic amino acid transporter 5-like [Triticum urartu]XP_048562452.1 cationic amino acid transporter 5-like [Triticum urartu]
MAAVGTPQEPYAPKPAGEGRGYWRWHRDDFFPEPSFASWGAYRSALAATPARLRDRFTGRSTDAIELGALRRRSENEMRRCLTWWDLTWFGFGSVIGAGIFVLTGQEAHDHAGPAIVLSYIVSGLSAMLSVFCYTEFAVEIPVAGGSFAYLRVELGDVAAFIAAANLILESIIGTAAVARSWTSYFASLINKPASALRIQTSLKDGYNELDPIAVVVIAVTATMAILSAKGTSRINWVASAIHVVVIAFVIVAGFIHANPSNLTPFMPHGVPGVFQAAAIVYFAYGGFDNIATMAEEVKNPSRDIPLGLLGSMSVITVIYCVMALVLSMMQPYTAIDRSAAYSVAFSSVGMHWAQYVVALGALKGMTTVMLVGALGQARYTTHIARSHIIPPVFALVHPRTGTPVNANILIAAAACCIGFFSSLDVLSSLLSISTLFIFMMMATALLVRRYYVKGVTTRTHALRLLVFLLVIIASSAGIAAYWGTTPGRWEGYVVLVPAWLLGTLGIQMMVPAARAPKVWGVPLVPWLPSLSIATNLFLMGSLGSDAFVRFGACTAIMLIYYVLVGLHATYDVAHDVCSEDELKDYGDAADDAADEKATAKTADVERASAGDGGR